MAIGTVFKAACRVTPLRVQAMRLLSSSGSDIDRGDENLRQRENAVSEKRGDDEVMLPGTLLVPLAVMIDFASMMAGDGCLGRSSLGVAVMMMMMKANPRGSGRDLAMDRLGRLAERQASMMMIMISKMVIARQGGLGRRALATHTPPWLMRDANVRAQGKGTRWPMIARMITTSNALRRRFHSGQTVALAASTGFSTVQAQA